MYLLPISETATNSATNFLSAYCLYSTRHLDFVIADDVMNICDYVCAEYMGTAVATGSACDSKDAVLSHVIRAIAVPQEYAYGTIRVTLGMDNTPEQMDIIAHQISTILR